MDFLDELEAKIKSRRMVENSYKILRVLLMVIIAVCGFLTAAASQAGTKETWVSSSGSLLIFGLFSAVCAILNQVLSPTEKSIFHKNVKKALEYIRGEVKFGNLEIAKANLLKSVAVTEPEIVLGKVKNSLKE